MGIDLRLYPEHAPEAGFSLSILSTERDNDLQDAIKREVKKNGRDVKRSGVKVFTGKGFEQITKDAYGDLIKSIRSFDLHKAFNEGSAFNVNEGIKDYLMRLPFDTEIFIYWH